MVSKRNTTKNPRWHPGLWVLIVLTLIILYARILVTKTSMLLLARLKLDQTSGFLVKVLLSPSFSLGFWLYGLLLVLLGFLHLRFLFVSSAFCVPTSPSVC